MKNDWAFYNASDYFSSVNVDTSCYISGASPAIFLYPQVPINITISPPTKLTYTFPPTKNSWQVLASPNGEINVNKQLLPINYLYYEYDKQFVSFSEPEEGFLVERENWQNLTKTIAEQSGLIPAETAQLINEIKNTLLDLPPSPYLKFSFVKKMEVEKNLPLKIDPAPDHLYRIQFLLIPEFSPEPNIKNPTLNPLKREGFTAIEIGAINL